MGRYATGHAAWGWAVEPPEEVEEWYDWAEEIGFGWLACDYADSGETPTIIFCVGPSAQAEAGAAPARVPSCPNPGEVANARRELIAKGVLDAENPVSFGCWVGASFG